MILKISLETLNDNLVLLIRQIVTHTIDGVIRLLGINIVNLSML